MCRFVAVLVVLAFWQLAHTDDARAQDKPKPEADGKETLDSLQAEAIRNNPDLRVSQAELRLAEARFERFRFDLQARVAAAVHDVERARGSLQDADTNKDRASKLPLGREEHAQLVLNAIKAKADAHLAETRLEALLGRAKKDGGLAKDLVLKDLQAEAAKTNVDHRHETAKLKLAEAEFERARRTLLAQVEVLKAESEAANAVVKESNQRLATAKKLYDRGVIGRDELQSAELTATKLNHERLIVEARFNQLLGRPAATSIAPQKDTPQ